MTVGIIGLGLMGSALAERFLRAGRNVIGFDLRPECRRALAALGGTPAESASEVVRVAGLVLLSLPDSDAVGVVVKEVEADLAGKTVIDTTTGDPDRTAALGARLAERGVAYLDATVAGSSQQTRAGEVVVMVGGEADVFRACEPLLRDFARECFHLGPWGSGARMKLVVNLVLGLNRAVLAEGLAFARRCGIDPESALEVLKSGAAYSRVMDTKGRKMIAEDFTPEARLGQHLKDVRLILAAGERAGAVLPLSELHARLLEGLRAAGLGDLDNSAIIQAFAGGER